ncbi:MAG: GpE family phage tail protein [Sphingobium sp.]
MGRARCGPARHCRPRRHRRDYRGFYCAWPSNWRDLLGELAAVFHFQPSELWAMDWEELLMWRDQAERMAREAKPDT